MVENARVAVAAVEVLSSQPPSTPLQTHQHTHKKLFTLSSSITSIVMAPCNYKRQKSTQISNQSK